MNEEMKCQYCSIDLSSAETFTMNRRHGVTYYMCDKCKVSYRIMKDATMEAIEHDRVRFAALNPPERLNGKTSKEDAKV